MTHRRLLLSLSCLLALAGLAPPAAAATNLPEAEPGQPLLVRQALIAEPRADKRRRGQMTDGKPQSYWASFAETSKLIYDAITNSHERYWLGQNRRAYSLRLGFSQEEEINFVAAMSFDNSFRQANKTFLDAGGAELGSEGDDGGGFGLSFSGGSGGWQGDRSKVYFSGHALRNTRTRELQVRFERQNEPANVKINEIAVYHIGPGAFRGKGQSREFSLNRNGDGECSIRGLSDTGVEALTFTFRADGAGLVDFELLDPDTTGGGGGEKSRLPFWTQRSFLHLPIRVTGAGEITITLDIPDVVLDRGDWPLIIRSQPGLSDLRVAVHTVDSRQAVDEFNVQQLMLARQYYTVASEARAWGKGNNRVSRVHARYRRILKLNPNHEEAIYNYGYIRKSWRADSLTLEAPEGAPDWAVLQRGILQINDRIADHWVSLQDEDGQFGGGINDDCVLSCQLGWIGMLNDDGSHELADSLARFSDFSWSVPERWTNGFPEIYATDLLHASDELAETHPPLMIFKYGEPRFVERNMQSFQAYFGPHTGKKGNVRVITNRRWTGGSYKANRRFRAAAPGMYVMWYSALPQATEWCCEFTRGWMTGQVPDDYHGSAGAFDYEFALGCWYATGEREFFDRAASFGSTNIRPTTRRLKAFMGNDAPTMPSSKRNGIGDTGSLRVKRQGDRMVVSWPADGGGIRPQNLNEFDMCVDLLNGDRAALAGMYVTTLVATRLMENPYSTAEACTDRVYPVGRFIMPHTMMGGPASVRASFPIYAATYEGFGNDFAALVLGNNDRYLKLLIYNFRPREVRGKVWVWQLANGRYSVNFGPDNDQDDRADGGQSREMVLHRGVAIPVTLEGNKMHVLEVRQQERLDPLRERADLAIDHTDVRAGGGGVRVRVHNLGPRAAEGVVVRLEGGGSETVDVPAPRGLAPSVVEVNLSGNGRRVVIDPDNRIPEICETNNSVDL